MKFRFVAAVLSSSLLFSCMGGTLAQWCRENPDSKCICSGNADETCCVQETGACVQDSDCCASSRCAPVDGGTACVLR